MRQDIELACNNKHDALMLLQRISRFCGFDLRLEMARPYMDWVETVDRGMGAQMTSLKFNEGTRRELDEIIAFQAAQARGMIGPTEGRFVSPSAAIMKGLRDYLAYVLLMLPVGTNVYWLPGKDCLRLVVTDEKAPKGYVKLL
jgi:hypothetical protein